MMGRVVRLTLLPALVVAGVLAPGSGNAQVRTPPASRNLTVTGNITSVTAGFGGVGTLVITPTNGKPVTLNVTGATFITLDRVAGKQITNLNALMQAAATYQANGTALRIDASDTYTVQGTITTVVPDANGVTGTVVVSGSEAQSVSLNIGTTTAITINRLVSRPIGELFVGMKAEVSYQITAPGTGNALKFLVSANNLISGIITGINPVTGVLTLTTSSGQTFAVAIPPNTPIGIDRTGGLAVANLALGMKIDAALTLTGNGVATARKLDAFDRVTIHGFISAVNSLTGTLAITPANGPAVVLATAPATTFTVDRAAVQNLAGVLVGMKVEAFYSTTGVNTGTAIKVDATDRFTIRGTLTTVSPDPNGVTGGVVLTSAKAPPLTLTVTPATTVVVGKKLRPTLANLNLGMKAEAIVQVTATGNFVVKIEALVPK